MLDKVRKYIYNILRKSKEEEEYASCQSEERGRSV